MIALIARFPDIVEKPWLFGLCPETSWLRRYDITINEYVGILSHQAYTPIP
jgi:hypothetical protein